MPASTCLSTLGPRCVFDEIQRWPPVLRQQRAGGGDQVGVVALLRPQRRARARHGGRVEDDDVVGRAALALGVEEAEHVGHLPAVGGGVEAREREVGARPGERPGGEVDAGDGGRAGARGGDRQRARVRERVEHALAAHEAGEPGAVLAHVGEQADVDAAAQVNLVRARPTRARSSLSGGVSPTTSSLARSGVLPDPLSRVLSTAPAQRQPGGGQQLERGLREQARVPEQAARQRRHHRERSVDVDRQPRHPVALGVEQAVRGFTVGEAQGPAQVERRREPGRARTARRARARRRRATRRARARSPDRRRRSPASRPRPSSRRTGRPGSSSRAPSTSPSASCGGRASRRCAAGCGQGDAEERHGRA